MIKISKKSVLTSLLLILPVIVSTHKLLLLNDIHLDPKYHYGCIGPICFDQGVFYEDSPPALLDTILKDAKTTQTSFDAILISGDFIVHGLSSSSDKSNSWPQMKGIFSETIEKLREQFPGTPIISSIGNNDVMYHYQAPNATDKDQFYGDLYDIFFKNSTTEQLQSDINDTFSKGGYYRFKLDNNLSILSINSMYMNLKNTNDLDEVQNELEWLESQLNNSADDEAFILQMHIFPGLNFYQNLQQFWYQQYQDQYLSILQKYQSKIRLVVGAHIHQAQLRAPYSSNFTELQFSMLMTPSVSPIFFMNPGYTVLDIDNKKVNDIKWRFFQILEYTLQGKFNFIEYDPETEYNVDLNKPETIQAFIDSMMKDSKVFVNYMVSAMGYRVSLKNLAVYLAPIALLFLNINYEQKGYLCSLKFFEVDDYNTCMAQ